MKKSFIFLVFGLVIILISSAFTAAEFPQGENNNIIIQSEDNNNLFLIEEDDVFVNVTTTKELIIRDGEEETVISSNYPSEPVISPDNSRMVYIAPYEWEKQGEIFLYDGEAKTNEVLFGLEDMPEQYTAKNIYWVNNRYLLAIAGYAYGTVTKGGDVYIIDTSTHESALFYEAENGQEVKEIELGEDITFKLVDFDEDYMEYDIIEKSFSRKEIIEEGENIHRKDLEEELNNAQKQLDLLYEGLAPRTEKEAVETWIRGVALKNAPLQYITLSPELKNETYSLYEEMNWTTEISNFFWVNNHQVIETEKDNETANYNVIFTMKNIEDETYEIETEIELEKQDKNWFITAVESDSDKPYLNIQ